MRNTIRVNFSVSVQLTFLTQTIHICA